MGTSDPPPTPPEYSSGGGQERYLYFSWYDRTQYSARVPSGIRLNPYGLALPRYGLRT